jgi:hypothetical protein
VGVSGSLTRVSGSVRTSGRFGMCAMGFTWYSGLENDHKYGI